MDFTELGKYLDSLYTQNVPGLDMVILKDHQEIYRHMAGFRDEARQCPIQGDEIYALYSCTKVYTSCALMQLVEREQISLDDPVSRYLPAYAHLMVKEGDSLRPPKRPVLIRHLLSMQSGMDYEADAEPIQKVLQATNGHATTRQLVDAMAEKPLCFDPGTDFLYSLSHDVLAAVIEVVTGMSFSEYLRKNIFEPLDLHETGFSLRDDERDRICAQYEFQEDTRTLKVLPEGWNNYRYSDQYESGGAGLFSTVEDYGIFADALACGGLVRTGARILKPDTIWLWSGNQLVPRAKSTFDTWNRRGYSYGLGVRTRVDLGTGGPGTVGEFGWDGAAGSYVMIDPHLHLSVFYAMHVKNFGYCYDVIHPRIKELVYEGYKESDRG